MKKNPKISVIMPAYNAEEYLDEAIQSILNQTFEDFEFIIINDGSTDRSKEIILSYNDKRIRYIENKKNLKLIKTLNKGFKLASGKYIARMDADDIAFSLRLEEQYNYMEENSDIIVCGTFAQKIGIEKSEFIQPVSDLFIRDRFVIYPTIIHPTVLIRRKVLIDSRILFKEDYLHAEDYKFWFDLMKYGKFYNIPKVLLYYRTFENQISNKCSKDQAATSQKIRREFINWYFQKNNISYNFPDKIDLSVIKKVKLLKQDRTIDAIIYTMYLSLEHYSFKTLIYFLFSFDYFKFPYDSKSFARIIAKHLKPSRFYKWL